MSPAVTVTVPATTANIGPGFDCLGAALSLYNRFQFTAADGAAGTLTIQVTGEEADRVATDSRNLAYQAFTYLYQQLGRPVPAVAIAIDLAVPLARGLGSSSTAIVGGLVGANQLAGVPLDQAALTQLAIAMEGHPDNVVPALTGGCQLAVASEPEGAWVLCPIAWHRDVIPVVAIPDFELSTAAARQVLPQRYSRADAIFNTAHLGLLLRGLETGRGDWLRVALGDRIHQPYRQTLIPGYTAVAAAARAAGAHGLVISGAGPTLLALAPRNGADAVRQAMADAWTQEGQRVTTHSLALDTTGVRIA
ncbi:homoserine kinase [Nodosilinea sp. P-1105]|uniref:homoserine kinase n=1 Tax=Nodosilinea sp. P-1105 TaxID=2546229 RepID=UPI00146E2087|nr:homoserine kinase [Nodosilinea sp. P-1105]